MIAVTSAKAAIWHKRYYRAQLIRPKPMPSKVNPITVGSLRHCKHGMDPAMKAGIGATICSILILGLVLLAIQTLPVSIGS